MYKNKINITETKCQFINKILSLIKLGIDDLDKLDEKDKGREYFLELKETFFEKKDKMSLKNPIKILMKNANVLKNNRIEKKHILNIRDNKYIHFSFDLKDNKILDKELKKPELFFLKSDENLYFLKEKIDSGGNGIVFSCNDLSKKHFAVKIFKGVSPLRKKSFIDEAKFLFENDQENIIKVLDFCLLDNNVLFYVMELFDSSLNKYLKFNDENKFKLSVKEYYIIIDSMLGAIQYLESKELFHTDIKLDNILVKKGEDKKIEKIVLADFGCIGPNIRESTEDNPVGNIEFKAPEAFNMGEINVNRHDIYSLGLVFNKILTGVRPSGSNYKKVSDIKGWENYHFFDYIISIMIEQNEYYRQSINEIIELFNFYKEILFFKKNNFYKFKKIEGKRYIKFYLDFIFNKYGDFSVHNKKFKDKFGFELNFLKFEDKNKKLCIIKGQDVTNYKENHFKIIENPLALYSFYDNDIINIEFYHMESSVLIKKIYSQKETISFYNKENVKTNYLFSPLIRPYDNDIFYDSVKGTNTATEFIVFNLRLLKQNKNKKFILAYNRPFQEKSIKVSMNIERADIQSFPSSFKLYFLFDNKLFPIKMNNNFLNYIKNELKLT